MKSHISFIAFVFLGCAAFAVGQAPVDDDDFDFEGSGRAYLPTTTTTTTTTTSTSTTTTTAPELDGSGSGDGIDDDEDYGDYDDYYGDYDYDGDVGPRMGSTPGKHDVLGGAHGDGDSVSDRSGEETVPAVHALPPATEAPVHREDHVDLFGAKHRPDETPGSDYSEKDSFGDYEYPDEPESDISIAPEVAISGGEGDRATDGSAAHGPAGSQDGLGAKPVDRNTSFFAQPGILAAVVGGAVVGLLCAILLVMLIVYRMRKKDEGSYPVDEPAKQSLTGTGGYQKNYNKEFYA